MSRPIHRLVLIVAFGLVLLAPWAATAQPRSSGLHSTTARSLSVPADLLARAWTLVTRFWEKGGCGIDPSGSEGGCLIDPDGRDSNTQTTQGEGGCIIDPNGSCLTTQTTPPVQGEGGCGIDPNGLCAK